jgi:Pyruvate/2-oxoacid:ferredoxin oxidoreductase gamma subunit
VRSRKAKTLLRSVAIELWKGGVSIAMNMAAVEIGFEELKEETRAGKGVDTICECFL